MLRISFTADAIKAVEYQRFHHPHPRVQQRMWALWLKYCGLPHYEICRIVGISDNTLQSYMRMFLRGGAEALSEVAFYRPQSDLVDHTETIEAHFRREAPGSVAEARATIARLTGVDRGPTQVRQFLHRMGMKFRKVAAVPAKADPQAQEEFKKKISSHGWSKPRLAREGSTSWTLPTSFSPPSSGGSGASRESSCAAVPAESASTS
jgi:transposase